MPIIQHLVVDQYGAFISKHSERLIVIVKNEKVAQAPLIHLESVTIANRGVSLSADVVRECTERGIPIFFLSSTGTPYASLYSAGLTGTVATRRAQLEGYRNGLGLNLALAFGCGKLQNQANLLKYSAKYRKETDPPLYEQLRQSAIAIEDVAAELDGVRRYPEFRDGSATLDSLRGELMGLEGRAALVYWRAFKSLLPAEVNFPGRIGRGATDEVNQALNYGYGILYAQVERALTLAGLDPYAGFLHTDRPGKPSLVLDFIEEFRQPIVDRTIIALVNRGVTLTQEPENASQLTRASRRTIAEKVNERLDAAAAFEGKNYPLRIIIQMQARHLATYLRSERLEYAAFEMKW